MEECSKCNGTGVVKEKNGDVHICWDCLLNGKMDAHSAKVPDSKIEI